MTLHVVDADAGLVPRERKAPGDRRTHEQGAYESRPRRVGNAVDIDRLAFRCSENLPRQGHELTDVIPGGELGHDTPEPGM